MPGFSVDQLKVASSDGRNFTLLEGFTFTTKAGKVHSVPAGAQSDGASTPRLLWREIPPFGRYWMPAYLHDWAYRYSDLPKAECDDLLLEAMQSIGVDEIEAKTIYEGVHLGGWSSFEQDRANRPIRPAA